MYWDLSYLVYVGPGIVLSLIASMYVRSTFARWSRVPMARRRTGAEVAAELLMRAGVGDIGIERVAGSLSDHYDPTTRVLRLSPAVYDGDSVSAAGVAAHECGHAIQHRDGYVLMRARQGLAMPARIGSQLSYVVIFLGIVLHFAGLAWVGVALFGAVLAFELVTLPVEIDASSRARRALVATGMVTPGEAVAVKRVLHAAAFTYLAALVTTALTLLYFVTRLRGRD